MKNILSSNEVIPLIYDLYGRRNVKNIKAVLIDDCLQLENVKNKNIVYYGRFNEDCTLCYKGSAINYMVAADVDVLFNSLTAYESETIQFKGFRIELNRSMVFDDCAVAQAESSIVSFTSTNENYASICEAPVPVLWGAVPERTLYYVKANEFQLAPVNNETVIYTDALCTQIASNLSEVYRDELVRASDIRYQTDENGIYSEPLCM